MIGRIGSVDLDVGECEVESASAGNAAERITSTRKLVLLTEQLCQS